MPKNRWIASRARAANPRLRLYCFPYAGRGASMYSTWSSIFGRDVEVCPVQLPGREDRLWEPAALRMDALVDAFLGGVGPELDVPFAFFGHSLGGLVAFAAALKLQASGRPGPERLFVSASQPPDSSIKPKRLYKLSDEKLIAELRRWNGTPEPVLRDPELLKIVLPIMRADLELLDHYDVPDGAVVGCPILAFGGKKDHELPFKVMAKWRERTREPFNLQIFDGDHFFIATHPRPMQEVVHAELQRVLATLPVAAPAPTRLVG